MNTAITLVIVLSMIFVCSVIFHWKVKNYMKANWLSAITVGVILPTLNSLIAGYFDPFFIFQLVVYGAIAMLFSAIVGSVIFKKY